MTEYSPKYPSWIDDDYPVPDPNWDYYRIYEIAIALDRESTRLISTISQEENATQEANQRIRERLKEVALQCNELMSALN